MYISRNFCQSILVRVTITIQELTQADSSSNLALLRARHWFSMKEDVTSYWKSEIPLRRLIPPGFHGNYSSECNPQ